MKKKKLKKIALNKKVVSRLNSDQIKGGETQGCSDGCSLFQTVMRCTQADCTSDCTDGLSWLCSFIEIICVEGE
ncbi:hypothetical protein KORDIASMS9_04455 [Kordia sp. SMS9]|uniref:class I lanthipeptide n=1 Tax=Kordia sp. SMS9 TaxID=2282170 RepID=UPI000E0D53C0|nr:class I lanthipeptide [Kordia sp. SMS9]AXG72187.1 hypothetical protein KORDIASMS9_04455 [Kordia sp. SMS9]